MIMEIEEKDGLAKANLKQCSKLDLYEAWKSYNKNKDVINLTEAINLYAFRKTYWLGDISLKFHVTIDCKSLLKLILLLSS